MKTIIEMALRDLENAEIATNSTYESTMLIREALAQPEMRPDEISTDELIYMNGRFDGMKQERALWQLSKLGREIEAQPEQEPVKRSIQEMLQPDAYLPNGDLNPKYTSPPQRPWVGLTPTDMEELSAEWWKPNENEMALISWVEAKLKAMNT